MDIERIIIAGGGTAGHIFPGLAIAQELLNRHCGLEVHFAVGGTPLEMRLLERERIPVLIVKSGALRGKSTLTKLRSLGRVVWGVGQSVAAIRRLRPGLVVGVGGYASGPMVLAGILLRRPTLLHEQNFLPGLANRLLAPFVDEVAISFPGTARFLGGKGQWTGNPLRRDFRLPVPQRTGNGSLRLLVFGGSQGAHRINETVVAALPRLKALSPGLEIHHATGEEDLEWVEEAYRKEGIRGRVTAFITGMAEAYAASDLIISRAGATTCAELTAAGKAAILIPLAAAGGHQGQNADQLRQAGGALVIPETELGPESLVEAIRGLASDPGALRRMESASRSLGLPDAAERVAILAEKLMGISSGNGAA